MNLVLNLSTPRLSRRNIRKIRKSLKWSREKLSRILCVSAQAIYFWETGKRKINEENQRRLLELLKYIDKMNQNYRKNTEQ